MSLAALAGAAPAGPAFAALALYVRQPAAAITLAARENWRTIPLHPAIVAVALALQWNALLRPAPGRRRAVEGPHLPGELTIDASQP